MANSPFTAYIFEEDRQKLKREAGGSGGGSLFGQWTSTGNPVVHYAVPSYVDKDTSVRVIGEELWSRYRLCHIGEWRSVSQYSGRSDHERSRLRSEFNGGNPKRFLVLDVDTTKICPYLFESEIQMGRGNLEPLDGENPFNRSDVDPLKTRRQHYHSPEQPTTTQEWGWSQPKRHELQEAVTRRYQWYSVAGGNEKLLKVLEEFKKIAHQGEVNMSRDTTTENMMMSFIEKRHRHKWQVNFPSTFPTAGAVLIENPDSRGGGTDHRQATNSKVDQAVRNMISTIQSPFSSGKRYYRN